jgi:hypothetical protein
VDDIWFGIRDLWKTIETSMPVALSRDGVINKLYRVNEFRYFLISHRFKIRIGSIHSLRPTIVGDSGQCRDSSAYLLRKDRIPVRTNGFKRSNVRSRSDITITR